ncbi:hypothetical protein [Mycolicibacterium sp. F2034L]|uniref:hypothetical protein n=1 Tax=Mycolicibacterium sp. F2034L TaxID=2926422 RepID=UPI001FF46204|nr:hypothetical protein [Mycolicibacterium sp. F2034L]MCK0175358.1 hypothetical protein [Mycolicibacterium sp. F2034L]
MAGPSSAPFLLAARFFAVATVFVVVVSFGTAGVLVQEGRAEDIHGYAAIALHVVTAGLLVSLGGFVYARRRHWWTAIVAALLLMYTFIQARLGDGATLDLHIPGALLVAIASVWLTAWLFTARPDGV